jgi:hypothetical protein
MHDGGGGHFGGGDFGGHHVPHTGHDPGIHHHSAHHHNAGDTQWYPGPGRSDPVRRGRVHGFSALAVVLLAVVLAIVLLVTI